MQVLNEAGEVIGNTEIPDAPSIDIPPVSEPPQKRGRGRPPKSEKLITEEIPTTGEKSAAKKPSKSKTAYTQSGIDELGKKLVGLHLLAAMGTGIGELVISEKEGESLAKAMAMVAEQYGLELEGKTGAALNLVATAAMLYVPRVLAFAQRAKQAQKNNQTIVAQ